LPTHLRAPTPTQPTRPIYLRLPASVSVVPFADAVLNCCVTCSGETCCDIAPFAAASVRLRAVISPTVKSPMPCVTDISPLADMEPPFLRKAIGDIKAGTAAGSDDASPIGQGQRTQVGDAGITQDAAADTTLPLPPILVTFSVPPDRYRLEPALNVMLLTVSTPS
jgi:hypothetical protein